MISLSTLKRFLAEKFHMKESAALDEDDRIRMINKEKDIVFDILKTDEKLSIVLEKFPNEYVKIADPNASLKEIKSILRDMAKEYGDLK